VVYYGALTALLLLGWFLGAAFRFEAGLAVFVLATAGAVASVFLFALMVLGKAPFCPLCAGTHIINLLLLPVSKRFTGRSLPQLLRALGTGIVAVLGGRTVSSDAGRIKLLGGLAGVLVVAVLYQWLFIQEKRHTPAEFDVRHALATFAISPRIDIPTGEDDPHLGPADAWVRVVMFTDFQCPGCRGLAAELDPIVEGFRGRVQVVFKHFPVSKTCNPALKDDPHPHACAAAWAADAARRQKKFWTFHDALFAADVPSEEAIEEIARHIGLDLGQFEADRRGNYTRAKVQEDIELGMRLGLDETPAIFVNGRRAPDVRAQSLKMFIVSEIASRSQLPIPTPVGEETHNGGN
jgi:protein-disulfide isomerase